MTLKGFAIRWVFCSHQPVIKTNQLQPVVMLRLRPYQRASVSGFFGFWSGFSDGFVLVGASDTQRLREADPVIYINLPRGVMGRDIPKLFSFAGCVVCFMTGWSISWILIGTKYMDLIGTKYIMRLKNTERWSFWKHWVVISSLWGRTVWSCEERSIIHPDPGFVLITSSKSCCWLESAMGSSSLARKTSCSYVPKTSNFNPVA